jgi:SEC-C motif-containing protein
MVNTKSPCYCGSSLSFEQCCQPYLNKESGAGSPETLMRSRYTAFVLKNMDYLIETQDPQTRQDFDIKLNREWAESVVFQKLEILRSEESGTKGLVEFKATFEDLKTKQTTVHHEISKFRKQAGVWYFREGKVIPPPATATQ